MDLLMQMASLGKTLGPIATDSAAADSGTQTANGEALTGNEGTVLSFPSMLVQQQMTLQGQDTTNSAATEADSVEEAIALMPMGQPIIEAVQATENGAEVAKGQKAPDGTATSQGMPATKLAAMLSAQATTETQTAPEAQIATETKAGTTTTGTETTAAGTPTIAGSDPTLTIAAQLQDMRSGMKWIAPNESPQGAAEAQASGPAAKAGSTPTAQASGSDSATVLPSHLWNSQTVEGTEDAAALKSASSIVTELATPANASMEAAAAATSESSADGQSEAAPAETTAQPVAIVAAQETDAAATANPNSGNEGVVIGGQSVAAADANAQSDQSGAESQSTELNKAAAETAHPKTGFESNRVFDTLVARAAGSNSRTEQAASIRDQVIQQVGKSVGSAKAPETMTLNLNPENLGHVEIQFKGSEDHLQVTITASGKEAELALREGLKELADGIIERSGRWQHVDVKVEIKDSETRRQERSDEHADENEGQGSQQQSGQQRNDQQDHGEAAREWADARTGV